MTAFEDRSKPMHTEAEDAPWTYRVTTYGDCAALRPVFELLRQLEHGALMQHTAQLIDDVRASIAPHQQRIRAALDARHPGIADFIDQHIEDIRCTPRKLPRFRHPNWSVEESRWSAFYTYWRYSREVIGKEGLSRTAIERQFGPWEYVAYDDERKTYLPSVEYPCPFCQQLGTFTTSQAVLRGRRSAWFSCGQCGHREEWNESVDYIEEVNLLQCECPACQEAVTKIAATAVPIAKRLPALLGQCVREKSLNEEAHVRQRATRTAGRALSGLARQAQALIVAGMDPSEAVHQVVIAQPRIGMGYELRRELLDELLEADVVTCVTDWLCDLEQPPEMLVRDFLDIDREIDRERFGRRNQSEPRGQYLLHGFTPHDSSSFRAWVKSLYELHLERGYMALMVVFRFLASGGAAHAGATASLNHSGPPQASGSRRSAGLPEEELRAIELLLRRGYRIYKPE